MKLTLTKEYRKHLLLIFSGSMAVVAGMAWNDAFYNYFSNLDSQGGQGGRWIYAVIITILASVIGYITVRFTN